MALVGVRFAVKGDGPSRTYVVDEDPSATDALRALRDQWLSGTPEERK